MLFTQSKKIRLFFFLKLVEHKTLSILHNQPHFNQKKRNKPFNTRINAHYMNQSVFVDYINKVYQMNK